MRLHSDNIPPCFPGDNRSCAFGWPLAVQSAMRPEVVVVEYQPVNVGLAALPLLQGSKRLVPIAECALQSFTQIVVDFRPNPLGDDVLDLVDRECDMNALDVGPQAVRLDCLWRVGGPLPRHAEGCSGGAGRALRERYAARIKRL